ncbi:uncharacterized protein LOC116245526 [Nymphaea colorata]|uniref:uncharacterized protein LOC116245526 n=1 Tax=Nymphaea colorata TaxID=210225 RepID=UPI00129E79B6|nr:uncharacterized protein LOC116245526 [Nymphaea colorata]
MSEYAVEGIIDRRLNKKSKKAHNLDQYEYRVKWVGYSVEESTWEPLKNLKYVKDMVQNSSKSSHKLEESEEEEKSEREESSDEENEESEEERPRKLRKRIYHEEEEPSNEKAPFEEEEISEKHGKETAPSVGSPNDEKLTVLGMCRGCNGEYLYYVESSNKLRSYKTRSYMVENYAESLLIFYEGKIVFSDPPEAQ